MKLARRYGAALAALALCSAPLVAHGQSVPVFQQGTAVPGAIAQMIRNGQVQAAPGPLGDQFTALGVKPFSITDAHGVGLSVNTGATNGAYAALTLEHDASGNGIIGCDFIGMAPGNCYVRIAGTLYNMPSVGGGNMSGPVTTVSGDFVVWNATDGTATADGGNIAPLILTNAALKARSTVTLPNRVRRIGFYAAGDAPPLDYIASANPCALNAGSGDDGSQVQSSNGKCWLAQFPTVGMDPREFGADATGTIDSQPAIQAAVAVAAQTSAPVLFPPGTFKLLSSVSQTLGSVGGVTIRGAGTGVSILSWPSAGGGITLTKSTQYQNAVFRDLQLQTGAAGGGTAITLTDTTCTAGCSLEPMSIVDHVTIQGSDGPSGVDYWNTAIKINSASNVTFSNVSVFGDSSFNADGISLLATSSHLGAAYNIISSNIECVNHAVVYGTYIQGVTISGGTNIVCGNIGVYVPAGGTDQDQLTITGSEFNMNQYNVLDLTGVASTVIQNNLFIMADGSGTNAVGIGIGDGSHAPGAQYTIAHNMFQAGDQTGDRAIDVYGGGIGLIQGNNFTFQTTAIKLEANTGSTHVTNDNRFASVGTNINNLNAGNEIDGDFSWTPTLVGTGTAGTPTYTVQSGLFHRDGLFITANFTLAATSLGGAAGNLTIGGLPFAAVTDFASCTFGNVSGLNVGAGGYSQFLGLISPSGTTIALQEGTNGSGVQIPLPISSITASVISLAGSCSYHL